MQDHATSLDVKFEFVGVGQVHLGRCLQDNQIRARCDRAVLNIVVLDLSVVHATETVCNRAGVGDLHKGNKETSGECAEGTEERERRL